MSDNNLIERMVGMLPRYSRLIIRNGSVPGESQTEIKIEDVQIISSVTSYIKWPHTDDDVYLTFIDTLKLFNGPL